MVVVCAAGFVGALAVSAALFAAGPALAYKWFRVSSASCMTVKSGALTSFANHALNNTDYDAVLDLYCPVPDSDYLPHPSLLSLTVYGYRGTNTSDVVSAKACVSFWQSNSGSCGNARQATGSPGWYSLPTEVAKWQEYPNEFPYVTVRLPRNQTIGTSNLHGFSVTD